MKTTDEIITEKKEVDYGKYVEDYKKVANYYQKKYEDKCKEFDDLKRLAEEISLKYFQEQQLKYELLDEDGE